MQVTCSCGKLLNVPETLVGKTARCPACQKVLLMPGATPEELAASRIAVACSCGKRLSAPVSAAGKKIRCPKCNKDLAVPGPAKPPASVPTGGPGLSAAPNAAPDTAEDLLFEVEPPPPEPPKPPAASAGKPATQSAGKPARGPMSYAAAPAAQSKPVPHVSEDLMFDVEPPPPKPPKPREMPEDSPGGQMEKEEYGLGAPKCPNCKAELATGSQFCVECGTALATGTKIKAVAAPGKQKKGMAIKMDAAMVKKIFLVVIAAGLIGLGYWWVYLKKPSGQTPEEMRKAAQNAPPAAPGGAPLHRNPAAE